MGKRMGLARTEVLLENLKREINWGDGANFVLAGVDMVPNKIATTVLGLNPTWRLNFGGATLAAGDHTTDTHMLDVLTPTNTLFKMALALSLIHI